jgi:hypothetical protein
VKFLILTTESLIAILEISTVVSNCSVSLCNLHQTLAYRVALHRIASHRILTTAFDNPSRKLRTGHSVGPIRIPVSDSSDGIESVVQYVFGLGNCEKCRDKINIAFYGYDG